MYNRAEDNELLEAVKAQLAQRELDFGDDVVQDEFFHNLIVSMVTERAYQMVKWGDEFDAKNTPNDWHAYISKYLGKTLVPDQSAESLEEFRANLVKVITLAMAAIEWSEKGMAPRHYDNAA